jgi:hypothetical protein
MCLATNSLLVVLTRKDRPTRAQYLDSSETPGRPCLCRVNLSCHRTKGLTPEWKWMLLVSTGWLRMRVLAGLTWARPWVPSQALKSKFPQDILGRKWDFRYVLHYQVRLEKTTTTNNPPKKQNPTHELDKLNRVQLGQAWARHLEAVGHMTGLLLHPLMGTFILVMSAGLNCRSGLDQGILHTVPAGPP